MVRRVSLLALLLGGRDVGRRPITRTAARDVHTLAATNLHLTIATRGRCGELVLLESYEHLLLFAFAP